jgi:hypothetical protein
VESRSSIRQVQGFTGPSVGLDHNAAPDIKDDSSPIEYSSLFLTEFLVTLLVQESNLYCHQYCFLQATSSQPVQGITGEEMKVFNVLRGPKKRTSIKS